MNKQPTQEQLRGFWERHGSPHGGYGNIERLRTKHPPPASLNNLFRIAVPKAVEALKESDHEFFGWKRLFDLWRDRLQYMTGPALALFWTLEEVREADK